MYKSFRSPKALAFLLGLFLTFMAPYATAQDRDSDLSHLSAVLSRVAPNQEVVTIDDMLFPVELLRARQQQLQASGRHTHSNFDLVPRWTSGKVYYEFDANVTSTQQAQFEAACREWEKWARLTFIPRTTESNYIHVFSGTGNWSYVGMIGGKQDLSMYNWSYKYIICHEIAHALGVMHEQCRSDRDNYVTINYGNITSGNEHNFDILPSSLNQGEYDFNSVMHYGRTSFSKNGADTITVKESYTAYQTVIGQRNSLSELDKSGMVAIYGSPYPETPSQLSATAQSATRINLQWQDNSNFETGFKIERKTAGGEFAEIASVDVDVTTYADENLTPGTIYTYRVMAFNLRGVSNYSEEVQETTVSTYPVSLVLNPQSVRGLETSTATITLNEANPSGSVEVALQSANTAIATVPASVIVPQGATSATFTVNTAARSAEDTVVVNATASEVTKSATLTVKSSAPIVTLGQPAANGAVLTSLPAVIGTSKAVPGAVITGVTARIYRVTPAGYLTPTGTWAASVNELTATGTTSWKVTLPTLPEGQYTVTATARDNAGRTGVSETRPFWIQTTNPTISIQDVAIVEGDSGTSNAVFQVKLSKVSGRPVRVNYKTAAGSAPIATVGADYTAIPTTVLIFAPGETVKTVPVSVVGDALDEDNETFQVQLASPLYATISDGVAVGTIVDNDAVPFINVTTATLTEGNSGNSLMKFNFTLSKASGRVVSAKFATADGTATTGSDFLAKTGSVVFAPGTTSKTVDISIVGDVLHEPNETFNLNLSDPVAATLARTSVPGVINNDDATPVVTVNAPRVLEGDANGVPMTFTVRLSHPSSTVVKVRYSTINTAVNPAAADVDYEPVAPVYLTFAPGQTQATIQVLVKSDDLDEYDERIGLLLSGASNATLGVTSIEGTIVDDDAAPGVSISNWVAAEGNSGTTVAPFVVTLSAPSGRPVIVRVKTVNGTALAGTDFNAVNAVLTFAPGETSKTVNVSVRTDLIRENNETFTVELSENDGATLVKKIGQGVIQNDDTASASGT